MCVCVCVCVCLAPPRCISLPHIFSVPHIFSSHQLVKGLYKGTDVHNKKLTRMKKKNCAGIGYAVIDAEQTNKRISEEGPTPFPTPPRPGTHASFFFLKTNCPLYIHAYVYIYTRTGALIYKQIAPYTYMHIYIYTCIHIYIYTYIHIYIYTYIHIHTYMHTYTHTGSMLTFRTDRAWYGYLANLRYASTFEGLFCLIIGLFCLIIGLF